MFWEAFAAENWLASFATPEEVRTILVGVEGAGSGMADAAVSELGVTGVTGAADAGVNPERH